MRATDPAPKGQWSTDDELDVRFFFADAPSCAGGLRSNLGPQLEALQLGLGRIGVTQAIDADDVMVDRLDHAGRVARIRGLMFAIGKKHKAVLRAAYELPEALPPKVRVRFGDEVGAIVMALSPDLAATKDDALAEELRETAAAALVSAQTAYARARALRAQARAQAEVRAREKRAPA